MMLTVCASPARSYATRVTRARTWLVVLAMLAVLASLDVNTPQPVAHASVTAGALFLRKGSDANFNDQTNSISVAVDAAGGMHAAFANLSDDSFGNYHAYYDTCAPALDCANVANWTLVSLLSVPSATGYMEETQLALNAQGRPRILIVSGDSGGSFLDHYHYAECDSGCTSSANWTVTDAADFSASNTLIYNGNKHRFALDPQGRPRFVVDDGFHYVYVFCHSACTSTANWSTLTLNGLSGTSSGSNTPALAFNATGQPRLLAPLTDPTTFVINLAYGECNSSDCSTNADSWTSAPLISPMSAGDAVYSALRLTSTGQPRFAYYGALTTAAETLYYFRCNSACTNKANWGFSSIGLAPASGYNSSGNEPDLALDSQNRPRLSFRTLDNTLGQGLGYAWCNTNCQSPGASWQKVLADRNDQLYTDWSRPPRAGCTTSLWIGGYRSSLALDAAGNPHIGYDADHYSTNCGDGSSGQDYRAVRFVYFPAVSSYRVYLPMILK
jgi:hypothetical protein